MKNRTSLSLATCLLLIFPCSPLFAQQTASSVPVIITVKDALGATVSDAQVRLSPLTGTPLQELRTISAGKLTAKLAPGGHNVFSASGYATWGHPVNVESSANQTISAVLEPGKCPPGSCLPVTAILSHADQEALTAYNFLPATSATRFQGALEGTPSHFTGESWWNDVKVLADDKFEGRDTGSPGERAAQEYAVEQLKQAGAEPAGVKGFYQPVRFVSRQLVEKDCSLSLIRDGKAEPLSIGEDAIISTRVAPAEHVKAPLVFVGYGLNIPEKNYDDFSGLDVKGKIAVFLSGSPLEIPSALASHYQTMAERWKTLKAAGAVGMVMLMNPAQMDIPWSRIALNRNHPSMDLDYSEFNETAGAKLYVYFNPANADKLFAGSGHTFTELAALGKDRKAMPHFALPVTLEARTRIETHKVESNNIVAKLPGTDPSLKDQYVVLSAHIDHVGIGEPINGDRIYNGAMDNASGTALVLDIARSFKQDPTHHGRSILLLIVTGEEKGLLGSKYFAAHPTVPATSIAADVNVDMFLPIIPLKVLTVYGLAESDLGDRARDIAKDFGVPVQPDPEPLRNVFIRSDQYNFIRHGIPALMIDVGAEPGSPEAQVRKEWLTHRYHAPSDDVNQPVNLETAGKYEEIIRALLVSVANEDQRPQWKPDSFFRRYAG